MSEEKEAEGLEGRCRLGLTSPTELWNFYQRSCGSIPVERTVV